MKPFFKRITSMILFLAMMCTFIAVPFAASGGITTFSSPTLDVDPIKDSLSGEWNTSYYYSSMDPENSIVFGLYENIVAVDDQLYPIDTMPFLYFTSSGYYSYKVKRAVYNYQTRKYEFTNISGNLFTDNTRATDVAGYFNHQGSNASTIRLYVGANRSEYLYGRILYYEEPYNIEAKAPTSIGTWTDITPSGFNLPFNPKICLTGGGSLICAGNNRIFVYSGGTWYYDCPEIKEISGDFVSVYTSSFSTSYYPDHFYALDTGGNIWYITFNYGLKDDGTLGGHKIKINTITKIAKVPGDASASDLCIGTYTWPRPDEAELYVTDRNNKVVWISTPNLNSTVTDECGRKWVAMTKGFTNGEPYRGHWARGNKWVPEAVATDRYDRIFVFSTERYSDNSLTGIGFLDWRPALPGLSFSTQPGNGLANDKLERNPVVSLSDGNSVDKVKLYVTDSNGDVVGTQTATLQNGSATFTDFSGLAPGTYKLTAYCGGLLAESNTFEIFESCKITFIHNDQTYATRYVRPGSTLPESDFPPPPTDGDLPFRGWRYTGDLIVGKFTPNIIVNKNITVYSIVGYLVDYEVEGNGTVVMSVFSAIRPGETVNILILSSAPYTIIPIQPPDLEITNNEFIMPASDVKFKVVFSEPHYNN